MSEHGGTAHRPGRRRALVTGASSGIGEAVARLLARSGYRVALLARREVELRRVLDGMHGDAHIVVPCDLRDPEAIQRAAKHVEHEFGGLELLVNNAGHGYRARVEELEPEPLRGVFDTNVLAPLLLCQACLPSLLSGQAPVVINVASVVGRRAVPGQAAYSASKAAVCSIGEALRIEWADHGIAVCTLNPALTATGFFAAQANPAGLQDPDMSRASGAVDVARHVLELDQHPQAERSLRWKWRLLGMLSVISPRLSDRILVWRMGDAWRTPGR